MLRIWVDGDPAGGYMVDIHDGTKQAVYNPAATNDMQALAMALDEHFPGKETPKMPEPVPVVAVPDPAPPGPVPPALPALPKESLLERVEEDLGIKKAD